MNRLEIKRAHYFIPKNLQPLVSASQSPSNSVHRIADPAPPATSTTHAPQSGEQVGGDTISKSRLPRSASSTSSATTPPGSARQGTTSSETKTRARCSYRTSDGRRCRMLLGKDHPELCAHHALMELRALERSVSKPLARDIIGALTDLRSGAGLNLALANTFILSADGRISERRAASLSYLGQLLLQTLTAIRNDWRGDPAPSAKQALTAKLIAPQTEDHDAVSLS